MARTTGPATALPVAGSPIQERTAALLAPAAGHRHARVLVGVALATVALLGTTSLARATEVRFEAAHAAYDATAQR